MIKLIRFLSLFYLMLNCSALKLWIIAIQILKYELSELEYIITANRN